jgi:hypothetical protein
MNLFKIVILAISLISGKSRIIYLDYDSCMDRCLVGEYSPPVDESFPLANMCNSICTDTYEDELTIDKLTKE